LSTIQFAIRMCNQSISPNRQKRLSCFFLLVFMQLPISFPNHERSNPIFRAESSHSQVCCEGCVVHVRPGSTRSCQFSKLDLKIIESSGFVVVSSQASSHRWLIKLVISPGRHGDLQTSAICEQVRYYHCLDLINFVYSSSAHPRPRYHKSASSS
jgi:hypothetical protein